MLLVCSTCKIGLRIDEDGDYTQFVSEHALHGTVSAETDEYFAQIRLAEGYTQVLTDGEQPIQAIAARFGRGESPASSRVPPFGMPGTLVKYAAEPGYGKIEPLTYETVEQTVNDYLARLRK